MPFIKWEEDLSVGVQRIDEQHKVLMDIINKFHDAVQRGEPRQRLVALLNELADYTRRHFNMEEELMYAYLYASRAPHTENHEHLVQEIVDLKRSYGAGDAMDAKVTLNFLKEWLLSHIVHADKDLGAYLNSRGLYY